MSFLRIWREPKESNLSKHLLSPDLESDVLPLNYTPLNHVIFIDLGFSDIKLLFTFTILLEVTMKREYKAKYSPPDTDNTPIPVCQLVPHPIKMEPTTMNRVCHIFHLLCLVEDNRFELLTFCLQSNCSPN